MTRGARLLLCGLAALLAGLSPALAAETERILSFGSRIVIGADAGLTVTETLTVQATGASIRHGIVREFPTRYKGPDGRAVDVGFRVLSVRRDGREEDYHIKRVSNGKNVYMGRKDASLPPGRHTYELTYATDGQIGRFPGYDELYWNVTGNGWRLPIDLATAAVHLPPGAAAGNTAAYTGPTGAKGTDFTVRNAGDVVFFATTAPLPPGQGLTVAVAFPPGYVTPPSPARRLLAAPATVTALGGLVAVAVYFGLAWWRLGRDPRAGPVVPLFAPPQGLDAPAARFVRRMGFDDKALAAGLVEMAVGGGVAIDESAEVTIVSRGKRVFEVGSWQRAVCDALLGPAGVIRLEQANHAAVAAARKALTKALVDRYEGTLFEANTLAFALGAALSLGVMALTAWVAEDRNTAMVFVFWLSGWTFAVAALTLRAGAALTKARRRPGLRSIATALGLLLFAVPFWIGEVVGATFLTIAVSLPAAVALALIALLNAAFRRLLKAPTPEGRRVMDALEGFRLYLSVGERERLNLLNPPDRTPELFEKYLPYALALDVEVAWAAQFAGMLALAAAAGYTPSWYTGPGWASGDYGDFAGGLGEGFSATISSAATAPGSASGSGGGGSSGGGGGGGGGGGW
ncbi:MAG: DUF2207 domain-containing protein [Solidesulfovibrio sp. DCME]|uniref:DUF2207 domain-containing protein n=1 Tax=Solidesulfovibrio sp. DCME TaxID=3447380 RepID=UPI003D1337EF